MTSLETHLEATEPDCIDASEAAELLRPAPWRRLVVVGDSVAAGVREPLPGYRDLSFADRFAEALAATRPGFAYRNLGIRELTVNEITTTQLPTALDFGPDVAMVVAGGNDALGRNYDPDQLRRDLEGLIRPLASAGAFIVTVGLFDLPRSGLMPPKLTDLMTHRMDELDDITVALTASVGGIHVDTHHHPRGSDPAIYSSDLIHGNALGHAIAFAAIARTVAAALTSGDRGLLPHSATPRA
ncbi:SGNH/GDSL hydrolase family protein [Cryptosporangium aurantiacum]|uniref:Lysophospholipase L1 n=1 Tax=Cryptosporangium aurantiacum TaxID=134849 RepID=A0A1M7L2J6_9ACTN|nr:SGNH/GDSL hydrolase family protein [Cryptosporangium aurantiacum]SHM71583.1 Lysophospholipase L1 [Cryptosporangium aurantiacum]